MLGFDWIPHSQAHEKAYMRMWRGTQMMNGTTHHPYHWLHPISGPLTFLEFFVLEFSGVTLFLCAADMAGARPFFNQGLFGDFFVEVLFFSDAPFCGESSSLPSSSDGSSKGMTEILELGFASVGAPVWG